MSQHAGSSSSEPHRVFFGLSDVYVDIGAHIAYFFRGDGERLAVLAPFIQTGLESGDQCLIVTEATAASTILDRLAELGADVQGAKDSGQLLISNGGSELEEMESVFEAVISRTRDAGRRIIRIGGDMTWVLDKSLTTEKLLEWEAFYDRHVGPRANFVALCQYDHSRFGGSTVMAALQTHPLSIIGNVVQENPFYQDPEEMLRMHSQGRG